MSLETILQSRKAGMKPIHAIIVMSDRDQDGFDSLMQVQIKSIDVIDRVDFRPLVRMRIGIINMDQPKERVLKVLDKLADAEVTLYAYSGADLPEISEHALCIGMEKVKPLKWGGVVLWRY